MAGGDQYRQGELWQPGGQGTLRWIVHVDMDAFFASVEQRDNPALRGLPLIVGNSPLSMERLREIVEEARKLARLPEYIKGVRGVVASASYEARVFGVRSAMPLARALVLCPDAIVVAGRFGRYREVAARLRAIWAEFSPLVEPMSLDEAYLDMTGSELTQGPIDVIGRRLKARIREETALTASVGIAPNKLVAKIASDLKKPDGLVVVKHGEEAATLAPLPVRALPGVGPRTAEALNAFGITSVGDLARAREEWLVAIFGAEHATSMLRRAQGIDNSPVETPGDPKSISREITLAEDLTDLNEIRSKMHSLSDRVAWSLRQEGFSARCIYIKLRLLPARRAWSPEGSGFGRLITRRCTLPVPTDTGQDVYAAVSRLLDQAAKGTGLGTGREVVRLLGVGTAALVHTDSLIARLPEKRQVPAGVKTEETRQERTLAAHERERRLDASLDSIRERFGFASIAFGSGVKKGGETTPDD